MKNKSYKREVAIVLIGHIVYLSFVALSHTAALEILRIVVWPYMVFAAGAFGIDGLSKNDVNPNSALGVRGFGRDSTEDPDR